MKIEEPSLISFIGVVGTGEIKIPFWDPSYYLSQVPEAGPETIPKHIPVLNILINLAQGCPQFTVGICSEAFLFLYSLVSHSILNHTSKTNENLLDVAKCKNPPSDLILNPTLFHMKLNCFQTV